MMRSGRLFVCDGVAVFLAAAFLAFSSAAFAQGSDSTSANAVRHVKGRTIFSDEFPKAEVTVRKGFRFMGTQKVTLYGNAEAEQYLFAIPGPDRTVKRFYWVQFEQFLPTNNRTYDNDSTRSTRLGDLKFAYDVKSWPGYAAMQAEDPASDGAAIERLLAKQAFSFSHSTVRVRMFNLPSVDHRTELMIIYGEALPSDSDVPVRSGGVALDAESPRIAQAFLVHARQGIFVRVR